MSGVDIFLENDEGVHVVNPLQGEFTLCGDSFDIADTEADFDQGELRPTTKVTVTCPRCAMIVSELRHVRFRRSAL